MWKFESHSTESLLHGAQTKKNEKKRGKVARRHQREARQKGKETRKPGGI